MKKGLLSLLVLGSVINASDSSDSERKKLSVLRRYRVKNVRMRQTDFAKLWFTRVMGVSFVATGTTMAISEYFNTERNTENMENMLHGAIIAVTGVTMLGLSTVGQQETGKDQLRSIELGR